jgi:hypothetical protein
MARNWISTAARALRMVCSASARRRRHRANPALENLEYRLALSSASAGAMVSPDLSLQPVCTGRTEPVVVHGAPGGTISLNLMKLVAVPTEPDNLKRSAAPAPVRGVPATSHSRILHRFAVPNAPAREVVQLLKRPHALESGRPKP